MPEIFTTTSSRSWFGRVDNSFMGIVFGILFVAGSVIMLGWNEKRALATANSLKEGTGALVVIAVAWLAVRPLLGGTLIIAAATALILGLKHVRQRAATTAPSR